MGRVRRGQPLLLGGSDLPKEFFLIRCSVVNSETLWSQNKMFISDWEDWGGLPKGLSNSYAANCLIHLSIWSGHGF